jgi:membrane associated rhomboid family serine protease
MNYYRPPSFSVFPPVIKNLLIANVLCYIATFVIQHTFHYDLTDAFGLHYFQSSHFKIYQLITYMFLHDPNSIFHILFNMLALWMFGYMLENLWGAKRFLIFYFICGIGAGLTQEASQYFYFQHLQHVVDIYSSTNTNVGLSEFLQQYFPDIRLKDIPIAVEQVPSLLHDILQNTIENSPGTIGASGAIFGILLAFGMLFPNTLIYVYFAIPVRAKYFVAIYTLVELYSGIANRAGDNVAHFAHIGGMVFGLFLVLYWKRKRLI